MVFVHTVIGGYSGGADSSGGAGNGFRFVRKCTEYSVLSGGQRNAVLVPFARFSGPERGVGVNEVGVHRKLRKGYRPCRPESPFDEEWRRGSPWLMKLFNKWVLVRDLEGTPSALSPGVESAIDHLSTGAGFKRARMSGLPSCVPPAEPLTRHLREEARLPKRDIRSFPHKDTADHAPLDRELLKASLGSGIYQ
ncbi:uncharacterized protein P884DRAFT_289266 [Thermothelomyces heterothallicus CBS 202.75]|uniref:uncharacterized protein n=1 Tax=Thermothelomyces heterothallicus CBS 202.75 TaxID=1149848 RepID=UPI0037444FA2